MSLLSQKTGPLDEQRSELNSSISPLERSEKDLVLPKRNSGSEKDLVLPKRNSGSETRAG